MEEFDSRLLRFGSMSGDDVSRLDAAAAELGLDTERLMEHAGWQVARCAVGLSGALPERVCVVAGSGNNGGDGLVAARLLSTWGCEVVDVLVFTDEAKLTPAYRQRLQTSEQCGCDVETTTDVNVLQQKLQRADLALDALLGSGLKGTPRPETHAVIAALGAVNTLSIDVPSGLNATDGTADVCVTAAATCTLTAMKRGLWTDAGRAHAGRLFVADIGMPTQAWVQCGLTQPTDVRNGEVFELESS